MIKRLPLVLVVAFILLFSTNVNAECTNKDLEALDIYASSVKASYDLIDNSNVKTATEDGQSKEYYVPNFAFNITIYNITKDLLIKISSDVDTNILTVRNSDTTNNTYSLVNNDFLNVHNYVIGVYSNSQNCGERKLKTINLTKPRYNVYSETDICQNSGAALCQKFVTFKDITYEDFLERIADNTTVNTEDKETSKVQEFLKNNAKRLSIIVVLITFIIVLIIVVNHNISDNKMKKGGWKL